MNEHKTTSYTPRRMGEWPRLIKSQVRILLTSTDWVMCKQAETLEAVGEKAIQHNENLSIS